MFILIYLGIVKGFWSNLMGDIFLDATMKAFKMHPQYVELNYYEGLVETPFIYEVDEHGLLKVYTEEEITTPSEVEGQPDTVEAVRTLSATYEPLKFFSNGLVLRAC